MQTDLRQELETALLDARAQWQRRLDAIRSDRRRKGGALDADFEEQAVQRENDETLDALDARGQQELEAIGAALRRLSEGSYGDCVNCGETIAEARLRTRPTATDCIDCANEKDSGPS